MAWVAPAGARHLEAVGAQTRTLTQTSSSTRSLLTQILTEVRYIFLIDSEFCSYYIEYHWRFYLPESIFIRQQVFRSLQGHGGVAVLSVVPRFEGCEMSCERFTVDESELSAVVMAMSLIVLARN